MGFQTVLTRQPMPVHLHGRNGAGVCLSHQVDCQFQPKDFPMSLLGVILVMMVGEKMKMKKNLFKMVQQLLKGRLLSSGLYNMQNWTRSQTPLLLSGIGRTSWFCCWVGWILVVQIIWHPGYLMRSRSTQLIFVLVLLSLCRAWIVGGFLNSWRGWEEFLACNSRCRVTLSVAQVSVAQVMGPRSCSTSDGLSSLWLGSRPWVADYFSVHLSSSLAWPPNFGLAKFFCSGHEGSQSHSSWSVAESTNAWWVLVS